MTLYERFCHTCHINKDDIGFDFNNCSREHMVNYVGWLESRIVNEHSFQEKYEDLKESALDTIMKLINERCES